MAGRKGVPRAPKGTPLIERLWLHTQVSAGGCWEWTGALRNGYGCVQLDGLAQYVHRVGYELLAAPIPDGLQIDHLCRNRACWNPSYLEPVTPLENTRRGQGHGSETHCPQGHPYDETNTRRYGARRYCKTCKLRHWRDWYRRHHKAA